MHQMMYETNLRLLQDVADSTIKSIIGRLDKSLIPAVAFVVIDPNLLVGTGAIDASTLKDHTAVLGKLNPDLVEQGFSSFSKKMEEIEAALVTGDSSSKAPFNWYTQRAEKQMSIGYTLEAIFNDADASKNTIYFADRAVSREDDRVFVCAVIMLDRKSYQSH
jgi:hypothetical protein